MAFRFLSAVLATAFAFTEVLAQAPEQLPMPSRATPAPEAVLSFEESPLASAPSGRVFLSWEYLLWWTREQNLPPLVTRGPAGSLATLAEPGTTTLLGGNSLLDDPRSGIRITGGMWLNPAQTLGVEFRGFMLEESSEGGSLVSDGAGTYALPFASTAGAESSLVFASAPPGATVNGSAFVSSTSRFGGAEINPVWNAVNRGNFWLDLWLGFRFLSLSEDLELAATSQTVGAATLGFNGVQLANASRTVYDYFGTGNDFYAGQFGGRAQWQLGRVFLDVQGKLALGSMHQVVEVRGFTRATSAAQTPSSQTIMRGLFASGTNSGSRSRDVFALAPELNLSVGYQFTQRIRGFAGYNFLYVSDVVRPADQIDRTVNPTQVPSLSAGPLAGAARPAFAFQDSDFWVQGMNVGLLLQF